MKDTPAPSAPLHLPTVLPNSAKYSSKTASEEVNNRAVTLFNSLQGLTLSQKSQSSTEWLRVVEGNLTAITALCTELLSGKSSEQAMPTERYLNKLLSELSSVEKKLGVGSSKDADKVDKLFTQLNHTKEQITKTLADRHFNLQVEFDGLHEALMGQMNKWSEEWEGLKVHDLVDLSLPGYMGMFAQVQKLFALQSKAAELPIEQATKKGT